MARRALPSTSLLAHIRQHFALTQAELGQFLGVSHQMAAAAEAGRKDLGEVARHRLWVLARLLPPPDGHGPAAPDSLDTTPAPPDAAVLAQRLKRLRFYVVKARYELEQRQALARTYHRRQWALQALAAPLADPALAAGWPAATPDPARDLHWLEGLRLHTAAAPVPLSPTDHALRLARLRGLEAELAALETGG